MGTLELALLPKGNSKIKGVRSNEVASKLAGGDTNNRTSPYFFKN